MARKWSPVAPPHGSIPDHNPSYGRVSRLAQLLTSILLPAAITAAVVVALFLTAPKAEDFWWTDAASFALNGELIHDYIVSGMHQSAVAFANEWFRRYPAVTITLYPPIFPITEALAFTLFGFSHPVAQATVSAFVGVAAFGMFRLARHAVGPLEATTAMLLLFASPGVLLWSRQVMMELPMLAFLLLASGCFLHYLARRRLRDLMWAAVLTLAAVYSKQTAIFIAPAFAVALAVCAGWRQLQSKAAWAAGAIGLLGLLPLAIFTLLAAHETLDIALGRGIAAQSGTPVSGSRELVQIGAYVRALPEVVGWPNLIGTVVYLALIAVRGWVRPSERRLAVLMVAWFGCDWLFVALTGHFEPRYAVALAVPCAILTLLMLSRLVTRPVRRHAVLAAGVLAFVVALTSHRVSRMSGYDKVAEYILQHSHQDDVVWFQGSESKNLAFSLRSHSPTPKVYLLRAEKLLVDYHIVREWGVADRGWSTAALQTMVDRYKVSMVVLQPDFWTDLPSMRRMQDYIVSDRFKPVAEFPITADEPSQRATIRVFVNQRPAAAVDRATR